MHLETENDIDGSGELDDLDRAVLWAIRSVAVGRADCPSLRRTFLDLYGPAADQILCALLVMIRLLASRSGGVLRLHMPGSSAVSRDELLILSALAVVQQDVTSGGEGGLPILDGVDPCLASAFRYVAELLSDRGRRLTPPEPPIVAPLRSGPPAALRRTLH